MTETLREQKCCVCMRPDANNSLSLSRKIGNFAHQSIDIQHHPGIEPIATKRYSFHSGACEMIFSHAAGFHEKHPHEFCDTCSEANARVELRNLSDQAKLLLCDRLKNPLTVVTVGTQMLIKGMVSPAEAQSELKRVLIAARLIDEELTRLIMK